MWNKPELFARKAEGCDRELCLLVAMLAELELELVRLKRLQLPSGAEVTSLLFHLRFTHGSASSLMYLLTVGSP